MMIVYDLVFFLCKYIFGQLKIEGVILQEVFNEYLCCYQNFEMIYVICEDYWVVVMIDLDDDVVDMLVCIWCLLQLLWGGLGMVG